jgi:hypothetical protein
MRRSLTVPCLFLKSLFFASNSLFGGATESVSLLALRKNDPLVIHFLPFPIVVGFSPHDPNDAGLILRDLALYCPVRAEVLRSTPLFTYARGGHALGYGLLRKISKVLLLKLFSPAVAALYTWHSFRSSLGLCAPGCQSTRLGFTGLASLAFKGPNSWVRAAQFRSCFFLAGPSCWPKR